MPGMPCHGDPFFSGKTCHRSQDFRCGKRVHHLCSRDDIQDEVKEVTSHGGIERAEFAALSALLDTEAQQAGIPAGNKIGTIPEMMKLGCF